MLELELKFGFVFYKNTGIRTRVILTIYVAPPNQTNMIPQKFKNDTTKAYPLTKYATKRHHSLSTITCHVRWRRQLKSLVAHHACLQTPGLQIETVCLVDTRHITIGCEEILYYWRRDLSTANQWLTTEVLSPQVIKNILIFLIKLLYVKNN